MKKVRALILGCFMALALAPKVQSEEVAVPLQSQKGFIGYIQAGTEIEIKSLSMELQTLSILAVDQKDLGPLEVRFKDFEKALGGKSKVEYLNKVQPLKGQVLTLKHNLLLLQKNKGLD